MVHCIHGGVQTGACCVGLVSRCPGYIDVTLDDWTTSEELFHYDLAVLCPPHVFDVTFYLPHRALAGTTNRTFLVTLNDTKQRQHVFLTAVQHTAQSVDTQGQWSEVGDDGQCVVKWFENHGDVEKSAQGQLLERDDDGETATRVLLVATTASFCCLVLLAVTSTVVTVQHLRRSPHRRRSVQKSGECRWRVAIGVFVAVRIVYSLAFTFSGTIATCRFVVRETRVNYVSGGDLGAAALTTTTSRLVRRLADLERSGGTTSFNEEDSTLRQLHSSVAAWSQYVDDVLSTTAIQIAQSSQLNRTFRAFDRLQLVYRNFQVNVTQYIRSHKTHLDSVVAPVQDARLRLEGLLDNDWLRYARYLFQLAATSAANTTLRNFSDPGLRSQQFAAILQAGDELNVIRRWSAAVRKRCAAFTFLLLARYVPNVAKRSI